MMMAMLSVLVVKMITINGITVRQGILPVALCASAVEALESGLS